MNTKLSFNAIQDKQKLTKTQKNCNNKMRIFSDFASPKGFSGLAFTGFTLVELLISLSILAVISLVTVALYTSGSKNTQIEAQKAILQQDNKTVIEKITADVRDAQGVVLQKDTFASSNTTLILSVPAIDATQQILYSGENFIPDYIIYDLFGNTLQKTLIADPGSNRQSSGPTNILENCSVIFNYLPDLNTASEVEVILSNQVTVGGKVLSSQNITKSKLRNK